MRISHYTRLILTAMVLLIAMGAIGATASPAPEALTRRERFGVAFARTVCTCTDSQAPECTNQSLSDYNLANLRVGWYSDWSYNDAPDQPRDVTAATRLEYVQLLTVRDDQWPPKWSAVKKAATSQPGSLWIIGNEPECPNQGNLTPRKYAERYHEAVNLLRSYDSTARFAIGGIVEPTPLRLRWLEEAMTNYYTLFGYSMTADIDVWNIHMQILPEGPGTAGAGEPVGIVPNPGEAREYAWSSAADVELFQSLVSEMRTWLNAKGERAKPLIISEMGVLMPSYLLVDDPALSEAERTAQGDRMIEQYMTQAFDWMLSARSATTGCTTDDNLLVQRWLWFSVNDSFFTEPTNYCGFNGSLFDYQTRTLTRFGRRFVEYQAQTQRLFIPLGQR